jgi:hypothetical protein
MAIDDCMQEKCAFCPLNPKHMAGCPVCRDCGCEPHKINTDCKTCIMCENIPNASRGRGNEAVIEIETPIIEGEEYDRQEDKLL